LSGVHHQFHGNLVLTFDKTNVLGNILPLDASGFSIPGLSRSVVVPIDPAASGFKWLQLN